MLLPSEATQPHPALQGVTDTSGSFTLSKPWRPAWAEVDLNAIRHNVGLLSRLVAPAGLMAVVKADGYGHGSVAAAYAALEAGATWLGVALVEEGAELRDAGIGAPILLLSQPPVEAARAIVDAGLTPVVHSRRFVDALAKAAADAGAVDPQPVHLKVDTGMHRIGCSPSEALDLAPAIRKHRELHLQGLLTHFAVADEPDNPYSARQVAVFDAVAKELARSGIRPPLVHAANSAAVLTVPDARYDLVRCGIAVYGIAPAEALEGRLALKPALSLKARVSYVRRLVAGERLSYGLRYELDVPSTVVTVPVGYADGVPRRLGEVGGEVLIGGVRRPIAGTVTMDQLLVDLGPGDGAGAVEIGTEVVLLGRQGEEQISASEWAEKLGTIPYEVCCGIGERVPRRYVG
ncbi:MAG TPA: alanine racemase [Acidimicrobiia bacterium]|nr:alanine racemase [Acidimicrobiia bacterium]